MSLLSFPNPVNEKAARTVAVLVVLTTLVILITQQGLLLWLVAFGFLLRLASGPRFSPFGLLATKVIAPRLGPAKLVAGPPKRFAQGIGFVVSTAAALSFTLGAPLLAWILAGVLIVAASLEGFVGFCLGCWIFGHLQRAGFIPESVCEACANFQPRVTSASREA